MRYQKCYHATYDGRRRSETVGDSRRRSETVGVSPGASPSPKHQRHALSRQRRHKGPGLASGPWWPGPTIKQRHNFDTFTMIIYDRLRSAFFLRPMTQLLQWQLSVFSWKLIQVQMSSAKAVLHLDRLNRSTPGIRESENQMESWWNRDGIVMESCDRYSANRITNRQTDFYRNRFVIFVGAMTNRAPAETTDLVEGTDFLWSVICIDHLAVDPNRQTCCQHICIK
jgi:hypothetical protein